MKTQDIVWRTVDNFLGKSKSSAIPASRSPDDSWLHRLKDCGCSNSDCSGSSADIYTVYHPRSGHFYNCRRRWRHTCYQYATFKTVSLWPPSNVAPQAMCVHRRSVHHANTQSVTQWWWLPVALETRHLKKAGLDDSIVSSYRTVSNLPHLSKILEKIVHRQMIRHLEEFKLLPDF